MMSLSSANFRALLALPVCAALALTAGLAFNSGSTETADTAHCDGLNHNNTAALNPTAHADCGQCLHHDHTADALTLSAHESALQEVYRQLENIPDVPAPFRKCGFSSYTVKQMQDIVQGGQAVQMRRDTEFQSQSPSGNFLIHYDLEGPNAVDPTDENQNEIPDFIDSVAYYFDLAWRVEIDEIGFLPPPTDFNQGGSDAYDIYINDLGSRGVYGLANPDQKIDDDGGLFGRFTTYITIDNNFSPTDSTGTGFQRRRSYFETGIRALRVTSAHEFHHAIQLGGYGSVQNTCAIHELSSTWIEYRVHPDVFDLEQFIPNLLRNLEELNFGNSECAVGYHYGIFTQMLQARYQDEAFLKLWEVVAEEEPGYQAFDLGLRRLESSLAEEYCEFSDWLYYTGYRTRGSELERADLYPLLSFHTTESFSEPSITLTGTLKPFEQRFIRLLLPQGEEATPDTVDIALVSTDLDNAGINNVPTNEYNLICTSTPQGNSTPVGSTGYHLQVSNARGADFCYNTYVNAGVPSETPPTVFPNPYIASNDEDLHFPLEAGINQNVQTAILTIYDASQHILYSDRTPVEIVNGFRVVSWDGRTTLGDRLSSGVYIYALEYLEDQSVGKFLVKTSE